MSKYLILGDIHCRSIWKDIVAKEGDSCDKIIFLGDYLPPRYDIQLDDPTDACKFLYEILDFKDQNPDKVILLRGNHCCQMLGYSWADCSPKVHPKISEYCQSNDVKNWFLKNTQWVYNIPNTNIICSHAGIGEYFFEQAKRYYRRYINSDENIVPGIMDINNIEPCELFGFTSDRFSDYTGESKTQPCTWIRPYALLEYGVKDIIHIVGHTPVVKIRNLKEAILETAIKLKQGIEQAQKYCDVWCCDCLENKEYLIIEDGIFKPKKFE